MQAAFVFFLISAGLCASAVNMRLIIGRISLNIGFSFGN
jgi:hypothetical protein